MARRHRLDRPPGRGEQDDAAPVAAAPAPPPPAASETEAESDTHWRVPATVKRVGSYAMVSSAVSAACSLYSSAKQQSTLFKSSADYVESSAWALSGKIAPYYEAVEPAVQQIDAFALRQLGAVEARFPAVKTTTPEDLTDGIQQQIARGKTAAASSVEAARVGVANAVAPYKARFLDPPLELAAKAAEKTVALAERTADTYLPRAEGEPDDLARPPSPYVVHVKRQQQAARSPFAPAPSPVGKAAIDRALADAEREERARRSLRDRVYALVRKVWIRSSAAVHAASAGTPAADLADRTVRHARGTLAALVNAMYTSAAALRTRVPATLSSTTSEVRRRAGAIGATLTSVPGAVAHLPEWSREAVRIANDQLDQACAYAVAASKRVRVAREEGTLAAAAVNEAVLAARALGTVAASIVGAAAPPATPAPEASAKSNAPRPEQQRSRPLANAADLGEDPRADNPRSVARGEAPA